MDKIKRGEEQERFSCYIEGSYYFPLYELVVVSTVFKPLRRSYLTNPTHCSLINIHGCVKSHFRATRKTDVSMNAVDDTKTTIAAMLWPLFGESLRRRKATEHLVSHIVIK